MCPHLRSHHRGLSDRLRASCPTRRARQRDWEVVCVMTAAVTAGRARRAGRRAALHADLPYPGFPLGSASGPRSAEADSGAKTLHPEESALGPGVGSGHGPRAPGGGEGGGAEGGGAACSLQGARSRV